MNSPKLIILVSFGAVFFTQSRSVLGASFDWGQWLNNDEVRDVVDNTDDGENAVEVPTDNLPPVVPPMSQDADPPQFNPVPDPAYFVDAPEKRWYDVRNQLFDAENPDSVDRKRALSDCQKCQDWYRQDGQSRGWLAEVNQQIPCPCNAKREWVGLLLGYVPVTQSQKNNWNFDTACLSNQLPLCLYFHKGADGCIRSVKHTSSGAGQQCCYRSNGQLIGPYEQGAGTPDRATGSNHISYDVDPYKWCCKGCTQSGSCERYMELRRGGSRCV
jgi:hypothetical protein